MKNPKLGLDSGSTLEARAHLILKTNGLLPPIEKCFNVKKVNVNVKLRANILASKIFCVFSAAPEPWLIIYKFGQLRRKRLNLA